MLVVKIARTSEGIKDHCKDLDVIVFSRKMISGGEYHLRILSQERGCIKSRVESSPTESRDVNALRIRIS